MKLTKSLADNLFEELHNNECKYCKSCLEYNCIKNNQLIFKCSKCNINYEKEVNNDLIKTFANTSLPEKEDFCSNLNMEYIADADYKQAKRVWKDFEIKYLGENHDL